MIEHLLFEIRKIDEILDSRSTDFGRNNYLALVDYTQLLEEKEKLMKQLEKEYHKQLFRDWYKEQSNKQS